MQSLISAQPEKLFCISREKFSHHFFPQKKKAMTTFFFPKIKYYDKNDKIIF